MSFVVCTFHVPSIFLYAKNQFFIAVGQAQSLCVVLKLLTFILSKYGDGVFFLMFFRPVFDHKLAINLVIKINK